jgi:TRAP-type mannitol/chloroaromatic compound transport system permease small subunit
MLGAVALVIAWLSIDFVSNSYSINEGSPDPGGLGYRYLLKALLPVSFVLLAIQSAAMIVESFQRLMRSGDGRPRW